MKNLEFAREDTGAGASLRGRTINSKCPVSVSNFEYNATNVDLVMSAASLHCFAVLIGLAPWPSGLGRGIWSIGDI